MPISQQHRFVAVGSPLGDDVLLLKTGRIHEEFGRPFEMDLALCSETHNINFDDIVGQNITVRLELHEGGPRYFNGYVSRFAQDPVDRGLAQYRATVVPWLWFLTRTADCRIFQQKTVPDIIKEVFRDHGFADFKENLGGSYRTWEYCVQYRETAFAFVSRLMEQEGIYYYFEHDNGKHTLVMCDSNSGHEPFSGYDSISYRGPEAAADAREFIRSWHSETMVQPGSFSLNDFDFKVPSKNLRTTQSIPRQHAAADFEYYDYPGEYVEAGDGESYAKIRIEELHANHQVMRGEADARGVATGCTFQLKDHPRQDQCKQYLVTSTDHEIRGDIFASEQGESGGEFYRCGFAAIDAAQQFRPGRVTPLPMIRGPQTATVVGPKGEEIHTDEFGRVKVQFHWDRYGKADETSSCWIRVAQSWAGKKWGAIYLPRIGQEVIVEFLEGDPDRPIITGRVYNGENKPPYDLPGEKTKSTNKSNSSKGGGGFNEIRFEDKAGEEQIFVHAQKNQDIRVLNDTFEWIGNNRHLIVVNDQLENVQNNRHEKVDMDHMEEIGKDRHLHVKGKEAKKVVSSKSLTVQGDVIDVFQMNHSEQTTMNYYLKALGIVIEASTGITLKCGGSSVVVDPTGVTLKGLKVTLDGAMIMINSGPGSPPGAGSAGSAVAPAAPEKAQEADEADPGQVEKVKAVQKKTKSGKYGSAKVKPFKPPPPGKEQKEKKKTWIEVEMVDEDDKPVPGEKYKLELPDKSVAQGTLDDKGKARIEGIDPGSCKLTFPDLDKDSWQKL